MIKFFKFLFKLFFILIILCLMAGAGVVYFGYQHYAKDLPKLDTLKDYNPPVVSEVFANDGTKIGEFWKEKRFLLSPEELPKSMIQAFVASEDDRFFEHPGIDLLGILRAFIENTKAGKVVQGGSTITQQVTKSMLLSNEKSYERKIKEAILAMRIEKNFSKQEILYFYLNEIYLGNRSYGIEAAAQNYFRKHAKELTIAEAAMIAGLAKAPSAFSPLRNYRRAKIRQEYVINRMFEVGYITEDQARQALEQDLELYSSTTDKDFNYKKTPWFTEFIRRTIQDLYGEQVPYTHGLKIETTVDIKTQKAAEDAVAWGVQQIDRRQGYRGPLKHISKNEIDTFNQAQHKKILQQYTKQTGHYIYIENTKEEISKKPTPISENTTYEAVIIKNKKSIEVQIGNAKGKISPENYKWAEWDEFKPGDIIEVKLVNKNLKEDDYAFSLEQTPLVEGSQISYDPHTGFIKSIVGGKNFRESEFNRATQAKRQTGSIIKPLIYAAALDKGYKPKTLIDDAPIYFEHTPGEFWSPKNYGDNFRGLVTFESGLIYSRNVISVKILMDIGTEYTGAFFRKLGVESKINRYYSMALGANDMTLYEITRAFGVFPNMGILPNLTGIVKITDRYGRIIHFHDPDIIKPFSEQLIELEEEMGIEPENNDNENDNKTIAELIEENPSPVIKIRDIPQREVNFNQDLYKEGLKFIKKDKLKLSEIEQKILYGDYIPKGYTLSPHTANTMNQILRKVVKIGTGKAVKEVGRPAAGKTGTTNDETDVWFIGYTPELIGGVWFGFDELKRLGENETGGKTAAPVFARFLKNALDGNEVSEFKEYEENMINHPYFIPPVDPSARLGDSEKGVTPAGDGSEDGYILY